MLDEGSRVRLKVGPFAGLQGTVRAVQGGRVDVAVRVAGRELRQVLAAEQVELLPAPSAAERAAAAARAHRAAWMEHHRRAFWAGHAGPLDAAAWAGFVAAQTAHRAALDATLPAASPPALPDPAAKEREARRAHVARSLPPPARRPQPPTPGLSAPWGPIDALLRSLDDDELDLLDWPVALPPDPLLAWLSAGARGAPPAPWTADPVGQLLGRLTAAQVELDQEDGVAVDLADRMAARLTRLIAYARAALECDPGGAVPPAHPAPERP